MKDIMVRSYQESLVPKKYFIEKSHLAKKCERKSTKMQVYIVRH